MFTAHFRKVSEQALHRRLVSPQCALAQLSVPRHGKSGLTEQAQVEQAGASLLANAAPHSRPTGPATSSYTKLHGDSFEPP